MRLWSIHPAYLDSKGLVALWREGLLAQQVLLGKTKGYRHHPQLRRFQATANPVGAVASYLRHVVNEADRRGYCFDRRKIANKRILSVLAVTRGQLNYEFAHLLKKLARRDPARFTRLSTVGRTRPHPLFRTTQGDVKAWEIAGAPSPDLCQELKG